MKNVFILIIVFLTFVSCTEKTPLEPEKNYTGITQTSEEGPFPIGDIDPDDWFFEPDTSDSDSGIFGPLTYSVYPAYPNPTTRYTKIQISIPRQTLVKMWIDDPMSDKETVIFHRNFLAGTYEFLLDLKYGEENFLRQPGIVRVFIDFIDVVDIPLIHGDIQIIEEQ
ncbi:MAG: hypothetical protein Kow00108_23240 [Calditrichia bacterium]